jgi:hypothetical protein
MLMNICKNTLDFYLLPPSTSSSPSLSSLSQRSSCRLVLGHHRPRGGAGFSCIDLFSSGAATRGVVAPSQQRLSSATTQGGAQEQAWHSVVTGRNMSEARRIQRSPYWKQLGSWQGRDKREGRGPASGSMPAGWWRCRGQRAWRGEKQPPHANTSQFISYAGCRRELAPQGASRRRAAHTHTTTSSSIDRQSCSSSIVSSTVATPSGDGAAGVAAPSDELQPRAPRQCNELRPRPLALSASPGELRPGPWRCRRGGGEKDERWWGCGWGRR